MRLLIIASVVALGASLPAGCTDELLRSQSAPEEIFQVLEWPTILRGEQDLRGEVREDSTLDESVEMGASGLERGPSYDSRATEFQKKASESGSEPLQPYGQVRTGVFDQEKGFSEDESARADSTVEESPSKSEKSSRDPSPRKQIPKSPSTTLQPSWKVASGVFDHERGFQDDQNGDLPAPGRQGSVASLQPFWRITAGVFDQEQSFENQEPGHTNPHHNREAQPLRGIPQ